MKKKFKVGDRVVHKYEPEYKMGKVARLLDDLAVVEWDGGFPPRYHYVKLLCLAETPIQRMKRRYNGDV